jgi:hypothetical protein
MGYTIDFELFVGDINRRERKATRWRSPTLSEIRALVQLSKTASDVICDVKEIESVIEVPDAVGHDIKWYGLGKDMLKWSKIINLPVKAAVKGEGGVEWRIFVAPDMDKEIEIYPAIIWPDDPIWF